MHIKKVGRMSDNVIEINDPFAYVVDEATNKIESVVWQRGSDIVDFNRDGTVSAIGHLKNMKNHELRQLMIMWLSLEHPSCLSFDDENKEREIRSATEIKPLADR